MWFLSRSDRNGALQAQKVTRGWKFKIKTVTELLYPYSKNKGAD